MSVADDEVVKLINENARKEDESVVEYLARLSDALRGVQISFDPASEIASDRAKWDSWRSSALVMEPTDFAGDFSELATAIKEEIITIKQRVRYPSSLRNLQESSGICYREQLYFIQNIVQWTATPGANKYQWVSEDCTDVLQMFFSWLTTLEALGTNGPESVQRTLADALVRAVFTARLSDPYPHRTHCEQDVLIPVNLEARYQLSRARADVVTSRPLRGTVNDIIETHLELEPKRLLLNQALQFLNVEGAVRFLGTFFGEWKRTDLLIACRQAGLYGFSIQSQRRALKLPDRPVFGSVLVNGILHLIVTFWHGHALRIRYWSNDLLWNLRHPSEVVECFYFLCALKERIDELFEEDMNSFAQRSDDDFLPWNLLESRVDNWTKASQTRTSQRKSKSGHSKSKDGNAKSSDGRPKKRARDDDQDDAAPPGPSSGAQDKGNDGGNTGGPGGHSADDRGGVESMGAGERPSSGTHGADNKELGEGIGDLPFVDEGEETMSTSSNSSSEPVSNDEVGRKCASIASWRRGKMSWPVFDLDEWRREVHQRLKEMT